jgi:uncharacterized membrane protein YkgB
MISNRIALNLLRYSLGVVFVWFGVLKLFNASASFEVLKSSLPLGLGESELFLFVFSFLEILVGVGLFLKRTVRLSAIVVILDLVLTTIVVFVSVGFDPRFPILSYDGEFVLKNIVLIASGVVLFTQKEESSESKQRK